MTVIDQSLYLKPSLIVDVSDTLAQECSDIEKLKHLMIDVVDNDSSKDLTDVHPKDRDNVHILAFPMYDLEGSNVEARQHFPKTLEIIKSMPGVFRADYLAIGPNSIVPLHLDDMERPAYSDIDWYSTYTGIVVPCEDSNILGISIDGDNYNHKRGLAIIFSTQVPHSAWNYTNEWWLSLKLYIKKDFFI